MDIATIYHALHLQRLARRRHRRRNRFAEYMRNLGQRRLWND